MENMLQTIWKVLAAYGLKVFAALVILILGRWLAQFIKSVIKKVMLKRGVEPTLISFTADLAYFTLLVFVVIAALGQLGIQTTSFIAVIGAAGLAIGLALQGSLANFASGFLMILFRPFKVGDYIEGAGGGGTVEKMKIFSTQLLTPDNKTIIIPNSKLTSDNIINYSTTGTRRIDLVFGIGYQDDIDKAKKIIADVLAADERILKDPPPKIALLELADSSVNFAVRPWVKSQDYWNVRFDLVETIKKQFDKNSITIPFPQRDVHVYKQSLDSGE
ncbi:MAG: mechanosensitive ion channel [Desulfobacterales bacterium]|nr:mechanosensitive ion channel [Desulfobacterales bacterium]